LPVKGTFRGAQLICHFQQRDAGPARDDWRLTRFEWAGGTAHRSGAELKLAGPLMSAYAHAVSDLPSDLPVLVNLADPLNALAAFYGVLAQGRPCGIGDDRIAASAPTGTFHVLDSQLPRRDPRDMPVSATPAPFITFTGGTTGPPKAILRDQASWLYSFARQGIEPHDRVAILGGLSHSLALYATVEALHRSADIWLLSGARPKAQTEAIRGASLTVLYATPTQLKLLSNAAPCPSVTRLFVGGGDFDATARAQTQDLFPNARIAVFYGTSETSFVTVSDAGTPAGSVGKAYPGVTLKTDAEGLIWASSPMIFSDYLISGGSQARRQGDFVSVGDLGRIDADGFVYLTGRADRVVSISDRSVSLDELERQLARIEGIEQIAAIALPDAKRGHALGIALRGDPDLVRRQAAYLPKIRQVVALETWPMLASGKTDYPAIEALFADTGQ
jgi:long-chain acyl-CoA synthetase